MEFGLIFLKSKAFELYVSWELSMFSALWILDFIIIYNLFLIKNDWIVNLLVSK